MKNLFIPVLFLLYSLNAMSQGKSFSAELTETDEVIFENLDTIKNKKRQVLKAVIVSSYKAPKPATVLRSGLKPMDVPQTIQVIGAEIIEQQQVIRLSEVIKNANGVYVSSARGGATESFFSRGYDMSANNMFKNGFRYNAGSIPEVSGLEKVEFLKGGSALLFGNVAPGGILNLVTKTPSFKSGGEISMQVGSYAFYKPSFDFYGPLNKFIAYRINGSYENSESFRDVVKNERIYINPSVLFNVTNKTQITLQGDYLSADWTPDFGTGAIGKEIAEVPRNTYFGALWSNGQTKSSSASALINHDFNKNWKLNFNSSFQSYDRQFFGTERIQPNDEKNETLFGDTNRALSKNKNLEQIFGDQLSLQGCFKTGSIKHQFFAGADWENSLATAYTFSFSEKAISINNDGNYVANYYDMINLFSFDPTKQRNDIPNVTNTQIVTTDTNRFGIFAQDLISFTDKIKLLAGIRWSWQESKADTENVTKNTISQGAKRLDNAFSPKLGLVYQPTKNMSVFASYSNSFIPNTGTTVDLQPIKPSIIDQYEAGIKKYFWKGLLSTNITVYQITNSNLAQTAEFKADGTTQNTDTSIKTLNGETKSKGVEIDITASPIKGLNIIAGYSYNDMRYTKTTGANGSFIEGDRLVRTPANTANLSFFYTLQSGVLKGISFGAIGNYIGNRLGGWNNQYDVTKPNGIWDREIPLEAYTTIDASIGYNWKKISILCKLSNITNELNYTVHENYSINPIAPRQIMTSLKYKF
jgi:iron complex outermembrane recepter protein